MNKEAVFSYIDLQLQLAPMPFAMTHHDEPSFHCRDLPNWRQESLVKTLEAAANQMAPDQLKREGAGPPPLMNFKRAVSPPQHLQPRIISLHQHAAQPAKSILPISLYFSSWAERSDYNCRRHRSTSSICCEGRLAKPERLRSAVRSYPAPWLTAIATHQSFERHFLWCADENTPFIYNPSEARNRLRSQEDASKAAAQWICGETATVEIEIWNPTCQAFNVRHHFSPLQKSESK